MTGWFAFGDQLLTASISIRRIRLLGEKERTWNRTRAEVGRAWANVDSRKERVPNLDVRTATRIAERRALKALPRRQRKQWRGIVA